MIIWGWGGITSTADKGDFHCPDCGKQSYRLRRVRNFFKLYFIPIIPLNKLGEYVECDGCKQTYNEQILEWDPEALQAAFEAEYVVGVKRVMMKLALADGVVEESEIDAIAEIFQQLTGGQIDRGDIAAEIEHMKNDTSSVEDYVSELRGSLNNDGKEKVVMAALMVALADGDFDDSEVKEIMALGKALEMSSAHVKGIISEVISGAQSAPREDEQTAAATLN